MLEKREKNTETITQNAFVKNLCDLISKDPQKDEISLKKGQKLEPNNKLSLRKFFISNNDAIILKILINYFSAVKKVFPEEWIDTKDYILTKTVGFSGVIQALNIIVPIGEKNNQLTESFFERIFEQLKEDLKKEGKKLTISDFPSNGAGTKDLTDMIIQSTNKVYVDNSY